jgi:hypothetical protein
MECDAIFQQAQNRVPAVQNSQRNPHPARPPEGEVGFPAQGPWHCTSSAPCANTGLASAVTAQLVRTACDRQERLHHASCSSVDVTLTATCRVTENPAPAHMTPMQVCPSSTNWLQKCNRMREVWH